MLESRNLHIRGIKGYSFIDKLLKVGFKVVNTNDINIDIYELLRVDKSIFIRYDELNIEYQFAFDNSKVFIVDSCGACSEEYSYENIITKVFEELKEKSLFKIHNRSLFKDFSENKIEENNMTKEQEDGLQSIQETIKLTNLLPLNLSQETMTETANRKKLLIIDINTIPSEMKGEKEDIATIRDTYKEMYPYYDFLFINTSRQNMEGNILNNPPVYAI